MFNLTAGVPDGAAGSLREAISIANSTEGDDVIYLEAGTYSLSLAGSDDSNVSGDFDVTDTSGTLSIVGAGQDSTRVHTVGVNRLFHVLPGAGLDISGITVTGGNGYAEYNIGGGILNSGSLTITQSVVSQNSAEDGAGVYNASTGTATISDSAILNNVANTNGGGIYNDGNTYNHGSMTILNTTIDGNSTFQGSAGTGGGGIYVYWGLVEIVNSTISNNTAALWDPCSGGGIFCLATQAEVVLRNSTLSGNQALRHAAIYKSTSTSSLPMLIENCTITENVSVQSPHSGYNGGIHGSNIVLKNSIVAGNYQTDGVYRDIGGGIQTSLGNNIIGVAPNTDFLLPSDMYGIDPMLGPLEDNGGPAWTHALLPGSPAIDAGNNDGAADQRGITRPQDGDNDASFIVDVGAYELIPPAPTPEGSNVDVQPVDANSDTTPVTLTFESVDSAGDTSLATGDEGPDPPQGFALGDPATYYEITTTAEYSGTITVCIDYSGVSYDNENQLKLYHYEDTNGDDVPDTWVDCTVSIDKDNDLIYTEVTSLSPFAVFEQQYQIVDINVDRESINLVSSGVIPVTLFTTQDFDAAAVLFAGASAVHSGLEDADGDGDLDLMLHFRIQDTNLGTIYAQLLADDLDEDGVLDSSRKEAEVSLTGQTVDDALFLGLDEVDLFLRGKALRELLDELATEGAI